MTDALLWFRRNSRPVSYVLRARPCVTACPGVAIGLKAGRVGTGTLVFYFASVPVAD